MSHINPSLSIVYDYGTNVAIFLRLGMTAKANDEFTLFIDQLVSHFDDIPGNINPVKLNSIIEKILKTQIDGDYLYMADVIEYELLAIIFGNSVGKR